MTAIIRQDVVDFAPELKASARGITGVSDVAWAVILPFVNGLSSDNLDPGVGEGSPIVRFARILLAAHYGTVMKRGKTGALGPVTSEAAGGVRRSYGLISLANGNVALGTTIYGQQYLGLLEMNGNVRGPVVV